MNIINKSNFTFCQAQTEEITKKSAGYGANSIVIEEPTEAKNGTFDFPIKTSDGCLLFDFTAWIEE